MKSKPIFLVKGDTYSEPTGISLSWNYVSPPTLGTSGTDAEKEAANEARIKIYGINVDGEMLIANCRLDSGLVTADYSNMTTATTTAHKIKSAVFAPMKVYECLAIRWELVTTANSHFASMYNIKVISNVQPIDAVMVGSNKIIQ